MSSTNVRFALAATSAALMVSILAMSSSATAAVMSVASIDPFVGIDGSDLLLDTDGKVKVANDQFNDGVNASSYQDYGMNAAANRPSLVNMEMPNGTFHNVIDFLGGTLHLDSKDDSASHITDESATFSGGNRDTAYENDAMTWFLVYKNELDGSSRTMWRSSHAASTTAYGSSYSSAGEHYAHGRNSAGGLQRTGVIPAQEDQHNWFIAAARLNTTESELNGVTANTVSLVMLGEDGTWYTPAPNSNVTMIFGNHDLSRLGGSSNSTSQGLDGKVAEFIAYNTILSDADINSVVGYLNNKYFVPEPSSFALLAVGIASAAVIGRRRNRSKGNI